MVNPVWVSSRIEQISEKSLATAEKAIGQHGNVIGKFTLTEIVSLADCPLICLPQQIINVLLNAYAH